MPFLDGVSRAPFTRIATGLVVCSIAVALVQTSTLQGQETPRIEFEGPDASRVAATALAIQAGLPYVPGELLVRFKDGTQPRAEAGALSVLRTEISQDRGRWIGDVLHLSGLTSVDPIRASEDLQRQPEVLYAQPNYIRSSHSLPNDTNYNQQWQFETINLPRAWDINPGGRPEVVVGVVDSGLTTTSGTFGFRVWTGRAFQVLSIPFARAVDFDHTRVRQGREFVSNWRWITSTGEPVMFDASGHGSHVAGTIAQQTNNSTGFAGIAHGVTILPLKACWSFWDLQLVLGAIGSPGWANANGSGCTDDAMAQAVRYAADNGAKVINMSVGGTGAAPAVAEAVKYAVLKGAFVAMSAGNSGDDGNPTNYPAAYAPDIEGAVAVGSVTKSLARAHYSSYGTYVELAAPGGDGGAAANNIWQMAPLQSDLLFQLPAPRFDRYQSWGISGTSMASPHVAGVAALLYSQGITNPVAIEKALKRSARDLGTAGRDDEFGYGLIDARAALRGMGATK